MRSQDAPLLKSALDALTDAGRATDFRATDANIAAAQVFAGVSVVGAARSRCNSLPRRVQRHGDGVSVVGAVLELAAQVGRVANALAAPHPPAKADQ